MSAGAISLNEMIRKLLYWIPEYDNYQVELYDHDSGTGDYFFRDLHCTQENIFSDEPPETPKEYYINFRLLKYGFLKQYKLWKEGSLEYGVLDTDQYFNLGLWDETRMRDLIQFAIFGKLKY